MSSPAVDTPRLIAAVVVILLYLAMCAAVVIGERRKRERAAAEVRVSARRGGRHGPGIDRNDGDNKGEISDDGDARSRAILVVHASQTGTAERLAWQTAQALRGAHVSLRVEALGRLTPQDIADSATVLFIASTCGEGDPPDDASTFVRRFMSPLSALAGAAVGRKPLAGVRVGVLALGDRGFSYFCAFGRQLDAWLAGQGAQRLFDRIDVNGLDAQALNRWQHELGRLTSVGSDVAWTEPVPRTWRLAARRQVNVGSSGAPVFHLELEFVADNGRLHWEAGDLAQVHLPDGISRPREYSIASISDEGRVHLLVRQERRPDGRAGLASGWLTRQAQVGDDMALTLRPHRNFRIGANAQRPLILVANGTGMAGLRAHLRARAADGAARHWLVFGERQRAHDFHFGAEVQTWQSSGVLERVDLAFSRDQADKVYVQHRLLDQADAVRAWLDDGAAIYVCGNLRGMATGVEDALTEIIGRDRLDELIAAGRYRRDVY